MLWITAAAANIRRPAATGSRHPLLSIQKNEKISGILKMYRDKIRCLILPIVLTSSSSSLYKAECERDRGELVLATAQRLKQGLKFDDLRLSHTTTDGIQVYTPKGNFGRFGKDGLTVARVAASDIRCNYKEIITLWQDQIKRNDWDTSCASVIPIKASEHISTEFKTPQLSHFVEKSALGIALIPPRDYVIEVMQPYPGASLLLDQSANKRDGRRVIERIGNE